MRLSLALLGLSLAVLVLFVSGSNAVLAPSTFEGNDGDMIHTGTNTDWDNVHGGATTLTDQPSGNSDNIFVQGTKENDVNLSIDPDHAAPSKDDVTKAYVASEQVGADTFLYLAWQRLADTGDAHIDFELNQNATSGWTDTSTSVTLNRTVGDLLISYDFSGSGTPTITSFTWDGSAWTNQTDLSASGFAEAAVNTGGPITDPLSGNATIAQALFGEASIDLSKVPGTHFTQDTCEAFGSVLVKTRSSGSGGTSQLKDFILPAPIHVSNCGTVVIVKDAVPDSSQSFSYSTTGNLLPAPGTFNLVDDGTSANTKTITNVKPGSYTVTEGANPTGWSLTGLSCSDPTSNSTGGIANGNRTATIDVAANETVTCTFTNTKAPQLAVNKACVPTNDTGKFNLRVDGTTVKADAGCGTGTGPQEYSIGSHAVSETAGTGTSLANYTSAFSGDCDVNGNVTLAAGDSKSCTITNTHVAKLTVNKVCVPGNDSGKFNLQIDGATAGTGANAACGGTTGAVTVTAAAHTVGETAGTGTDLANYTSVISGDCSANGAVTLAAGDNKVCTITNTRKPTLKVDKVCVPANDTGKFNLRIDGSVAGNGANAACGGSTGAVVTSVGAHSVSETAGTDTSLSDYTSVTGGDCAADGSITLSAGQNAVCTITNTRKPTLTVNKVCVPSNDGGKFNLQIDGQTAGTGANATCGGTTGAVTSSVGAHTVGETAGTGTDLGNYTTAVSGDCAANGSISLSAGQNAVCTITNTRKPTLTVNKVCLPASDTGKFNLQIDSSTVKADAACGTGTGAQLSTVGSHTVGETAGTGTVLGNYTTAIDGDCAANGSITLTAGQNAVCTITNTRKPTLEVQKVCVPANDTGKFNLQIDGSTSKADAACGGTTGAVLSSVGAHTVGETAGTGSDLGNYTSVIGGDCAANGSITLAAGQNAVCTITNTRKPTLKVDKVCVPANDTGKFNLQIDGSTAKADAACGGTTGAVLSSVGAHAVGETAGTGTDLGNYTQVIGGDCAANGSITLAAGQNAVCTITNTRKPTLKVNKVCDPVNDSGKFNLQIDGQNAGTGANAACGGTTGAVVTSVGSHTVGETGGTGTDLGNYTSVISGDCAANGSITLAAGQNAVCTITNTHQSTLKVDKVCVPADDNGKFNLQINGQNAGTGANASCGGSTGAVVVTAGPYTVGETAGTGTSLSNYTTVIGGDCAANGTVTIAAGDNKVCTITNTRIPTLAVNKVCVPDTDTGKFNLQVDGSTAKADAACGTGTGAQLSTIGGHTVSETAGTGTSLTDYISVIGGDCAASGLVTLAAGDHKVCTITNTHVAKLTVNKVCLPANDTGKFNLQVDASTVKADAACGTGTGAQVYGAGQHTVGETAGTGTSLSNYTTAISGDCAADGTVTLNAGDSKTCTITNTRVPTLVVNKICAPATDTGKFNLVVDETTVAANAACGTGSVAQQFGIGSHTVGETGGTNTNLSNYFAPVFGGDCASNGTVTLAAGDNKTCTITNTRIPTLTVNKVCVPQSDTGKFNLQIDSQNAGTGANAACGGTTGAVPQTLGSHAVGETGGTGTLLSNYNSAISGDCSPTGNVTLLAGDNKVCTITNTRKPTLTVNKVCAPTNDTGKFNLQIDGQNAGTGANASCGGTTGAVVVSLGSHQVGETAGTGTDFGNYNSAIGGDCSATGGITLQAGENKVCTITNTRKPTLTVNKVCVPATDNGKFNLQVDGATVGTGANAACGGTTGAVFATLGTHTVGETAGTGTDLANAYFAPDFGGDCASNGQVTLAAGQNAVCTVTNYRKGSIAITKNPAAQSVNSGGTATFTITVTNTGPVDLTNVTVTDPLSTNCAKVIGSLAAGASSSYTCTQGNVTAAFTNVATVTAHPPHGPDLTASANARVEINPPPSSPPATPTPTPTVDLAIVKTANPTSVENGNNVTYTLRVTNNGPVTDTNVVVGDSLPFGVTYVSASSTQGTCSGTTVLQCSIGTMTNGQVVTITLVVKTVNTGTIVNTATVVGALPETTLTNNTSSTTITVTAPPAPPAPKPVFKPPVVKPKPKPVPPPCYAVVVAPKQLTVGKNATLRLVVTAKNKAIAGVKIEVKGSGILKLSNRTDKRGHVTIKLNPKKPGIVLVKPASYKGCANPRIGVIGAFTPPVTG